MRAIVANVWEYGPPVGLYGPAVRHVGGVSNMAVQRARRQGKNRIKTITPAVAELMERRQLLAGAITTVTTMGGTGLLAYDHIAQMDRGVVFTEWYSGKMGLTGGTPATTQLLHTFGSGNEPDRLVSTGERVFFTRQAGMNNELWSTDGTYAGTAQIPVPALVSDIGAHMVWGDKLFFAGEGTNGLITPWISDGTGAGTFPLIDTTFAFMESTVITPTIMGGHLYFVAEHDNITDLYQTDGTRAGTRIIPVTGLGHKIQQITNVGGKLLISDGFSLFTATTTGTTQKLGDYFGVGEMTTMNGVVYFSANLNFAGWQLHRTNGTLNGTYLVSSASPGAGTRYMMQVTRGKLFYVGYTSAEGSEWWVTDGTPAGSRLITDLVPGIGGPNTSVFSLTQVAAASGSIFFAFSQANSGSELWTTDGTAAGTKSVEGSADTRPRTITATNDGIYFSSTRSGGSGLFKCASSQTGSISGYVFVDSNRNGMRNAAEPGRSSVTVFNDINGNGILETGEPRATTDLDGFYELADLPPGSFTLRAIIAAASPASDDVLAGTLAAGSVLTNRNFVYKNARPWALVSPVSVGEGSSAALAGHGGDSDGYPLTWQCDLDYDGVVFDVTATGQNPVFQAADLDGPATRTIALRIVDDLGGLSDIATTTVTITNVAPTASFSGPASVLPGQSATVQFASAADPSASDRASLTFSYDFDNDGVFEIAATSLVSAVVPDSYLASSGARIIRGRVADDDGGYTDYTTTINVNVPPVAADAAISTSEDTMVNGTLSATDTDSPSLSYLVVNGPLHGALTLLPDGHFTYTPVADYAGPDAFTFSAWDGVNSSNVATVTISIGAINDGPAAISQWLTIAEDASASGTVTATDPDNSNLTYSLVNAPAHGTVTLLGDGTFTYTPEANYNGPDSFTFKASDGLLESSPGTVSITVTAINDAPADVTLAGGTIAENQSAGTLVGTFSTTDADADTCTYALINGVGSADNSLFRISGNRLLAATGFNFEHQNEFSIRVRTMDAGGLTSEKVFTITVGDDPADTLGTFGLVNGRTVSTPPILDSDGDIVTLKLTGGGTGGVYGVGSDFEDVVLTGTTSRSALTISVKKAKTGDGVVQIGNLRSDGLIKSISGSAVKLSGQVLLNTLNQPAGRTTLSMKLRQISDSDIRLQGLPMSSFSVSREVSNSRLVSDRSVTSFKAGALLDSDILLGVSTDFVGHFAGNAADFSDSTAKLGSFKVTGLTVPLRTPHPAYVAGSHVSAPTVGTVTLLNVAAGSDAIVHVLTDTGVLKVSQSKLQSETMFASGTWSKAGIRPVIWDIA